METDKAFEVWLTQRMKSQREGEERYGIEVDMPACDPGELMKFAGEIREVFGVILPQEYLYYLSLQNGGGGIARLYGTRTYSVQNPKSVDFPIKGFFDANTYLRLQDPGFNNLIVFGETDLDYIVQDLTTGEYWLRSKIGGKFYERLPDFKAILERATA